MQKKKVCYTLIVGMLFSIVLAGCNSSIKPVQSGKETGATASLNASSEDSPVATRELTPTEAPVSSENLPDSVADETNTSGTKIEFTGQIGNLIDVRMDEGNIIKGYETNVSWTLENEENQEVYAEYLCLIDSNNKPVVCYYVGNEKEPSFVFAQEAGVFTYALVLNTKEYATGTFDYDNRVVSPDDTPRQLASNIIDIKFVLAEETSPTPTPAPAFDPSVNIVEVAMTGDDNIEMGGSAYFSYMGYVPDYENREEHTALYQGRILFNIWNRFDGTKEIYVSFESDIMREGDQSNKEPRILYRDTGKTIFNKHGSYLDEKQASMVNRAGEKVSITISREQAMNGTTYSRVRVPDDFDITEYSNMVFVYRVVGCFSNKVYDEIYFTPVDAGY